MLAFQSILRQRAPTAAHTAQRALSADAIIGAHAEHVVPTYGRFPIALSHGAGSYVVATDGTRFLDMAGGIAVSCLGHAHPGLSSALADQAGRLLHCSNLYYTKEQGRLAERLCAYMASDCGGATGKVFFANSGAEANEGMYKLARRFGEEHGGRYDIITAHDSFHGRTLGGISATGQDKIKAGFGPQPVAGFSHVAFNDVAAAAAAVTPATVAIMVEGIQGESGVVPATAEYLQGLRQLCDERGLLLLLDAVQCGHFRSGSYQSFTEIVAGTAAEGFAPDAVSMAKSLGGGVPIGGFWVREPYQDLLCAGKHGTTYGGGPLACAAANAVLDAIEQEGLVENVRVVGGRLKQSLAALQVELPGVIKEVRGLGMMLGLEVHAGVAGLEDENSPPPSVELCNRMHTKGVLCVGAGTHTLRFLPPFNLSAAEADEAVDALRDVLKAL